jgi:class 3 adenylate cyclase/pimeloyl-ACP methyl ester carboxylesterase
MTTGSHVGRPETRYVESPKGFVAFQAFGRSGPDLVFLTNWLTNVDAIWDEPSAVRYLDRLGSMGRVIFIDKRGSGVSDPSQRGYPDPVEDTLDDVNVVLDEIGSESAVLIGDTEGGMLAMVLAATYPERFPRLVLINSYATLRRSDDYPIGAPDDVIERLSRQWAEQHGVTGATLDLTAPSVAGDPRFRSWFRRYQRLAMAPTMARRAVQWIAETDVRSVLPSIQAETLVVHRRDNLFHRLEHGRYLAENIPGAVLRIVEGADSLPFHAGDFTALLDEVEEFLTGEPRAVDSNRMLSTVMFTDIVGSTAAAARMGDEKWLDLRAEHDRLVREKLARYSGREITMTGDGCLAIFDSPQRAVVCALDIASALPEIGLHIRAGVHTGEVEMRDGELGGIAVHIASRVMGVAERGGVLVSQTVRDLVVGSRLDFISCGAFDLKGVPGEWHLYEAKEPSPAVR